MTAAADKSALRHATPRHGPAQRLADAMRSWLERLAAADSYTMLVLAAALAIGPQMLPAAWTGNEIVYFDLAYRSVRPEAFTDAHAMFDASRDRIVAMMTIGTAIDLLGFEAAKTVLALVAWAGYALGLAAVARALGLRFVQLAAALTVFVVARQYLVGGEWMFGTIEPKTLAYLCVLFGVALALRQRWGAMVLVLVLATYFHFLIGGAWVLLLLLLMALERPRWTAIARLLCLYSVLVLPVVVIILRERLGAAVDTSGLPGTMDQVYALFRVPHHVAPFAGGLAGFGTKWLPGLCLHAALSAACLLSAGAADARSRRLGLWAAILNLLPLVAAIAAFLDRDTQVLAKFFLFRPSSPILLLTCLILARAHLSPVLPDRKGLAASAIALCLAVLVPGYLKAATKMVLQPPGARLLEQMTEDQRDIARWIRESTPPGSAILVRPEQALSFDDDKGFPLGLERLTGRGFIVSFKNVPSDPADFVRWYGLLQSASAFFDGDCGQLATLGADYVLLSVAEPFDRIAACAEPVYRNAGYLIARTRR